jgi:hypothetical protein
MTRANTQAHVQTNISINTQRSIIPVHIHTYTHTHNSTYLRAVGPDALVKEFEICEVAMDVSQHVAGRCQLKVPRLLCGVVQHAH